MNHDPQNKLFVFRPSLESQKRFKDVSAEEKLNWLEEANQFVNDFVSPEKLERWKKITGR